MQVINLLIELQDQENLSYIFISHDLSIVRHLAHRILVMYLGRIVEIGTREQIFNSPTHPYTKALLASTPRMAQLGTFHEEVNNEPISGEMPSAINPPQGCAFHKRCPVAKPDCAHLAPRLEQKHARSVACHIV